MARKKSADQRQLANLREHATIKLTAQQVAFIKFLGRMDKKIAKRKGIKQHHSGWKKRVAEQYGVSRWTIIAILHRGRGKRWRHVKPLRDSTLMNAFKR